jgi:Malectin domain
MKSISSTHSQLLGLLFVAVGCNAASVRSSDGTQPNRHLQSSAGSLVLINANTEQPIVTLSNNAVIAVNEIPGMTSPAFALDAKFLATNNDVQSVVFGYGANGNYKTENAAPYAFCGNEGANFNACSELGYGTHTVTITPFAQKNGAGTSGVSTTVTFTIVASRATAPVKVPVKAPTKAPIITAPSATTPILINCGGDDYTDSTGRRWMKDQFFNAGSGLYCNLGQSIANSFIDPIYQCERNGVDLTYSIPVSTGSYDVVLHFAELLYVLPSSEVSAAVANGSSNTHIYLIRFCLLYIALTRWGSACLTLPSRERRCCPT